MTKSTKTTKKITEKHKEGIERVTLKGKNFVKVYAKDGSMIMLTEQEFEQQETKK